MNATEFFGDCNRIAKVEIETAIFYNQQIDQYRSIESLSLKPKPKPKILPIGRFTPKTPRSPSCLNSFRAGNRFSASHRSTCGLISLSMSWRGMKIWKLMCYYLAETLTKFQMPRTIDHMRVATATHHSDSTPHHHHRHKMTTDDDGWKWQTSWFDPKKCVDDDVKLLKDSAKRRT